ncbi:MAG: DUF3168 domain-containing protein [Muribaculaceae bacterium]|nr:DUF3168 domain-containing protein [Muribaculaceae bacterium]
MNLLNDSLWIGTMLKARLDGIAPVYPCVATGNPTEFCVYRRAGYQGRDTKDRFNYEETINIVIAVVAPTYIRSIDLAQRVKDRLDGLRGRWDDKLIEDITMTNAVEEYGDDAYVQQLFFSITLDTSNGK